MVEVLIRTPTGLTQVSEARAKRLGFKSTGSKQRGLTIYAKTVEEESEPKPRPRPKPRVTVKREAVLEAMEEVELPEDKITPTSQITQGTLTTPTVPTPPITKSEPEPTPTIPPPTQVTTPPPPPDVKKLEISEIEEALGRRGAFEEAKQVVIEQEANIKAQEREIKETIAERQRLKKQIEEVKANPEKYDPISLNQFLTSSKEALEQYNTSIEEMRANKKLMREQRGVLIKQRDVATKQLVVTPQTPTPVLKKGDTRGFSLAGLAVEAGVPEMAVGAVVAGEELIRLPITIAEAFAKPEKQLALGTETPFGLTKEEITAESPLLTQPTPAVWKDPRQLLAFPEIEKGYKFVTKIEELYSAKQIAKAVGTAVSARVAKEIIEPEVVGVKLAGKDRYKVFTKAVYDDIIAKGVGEVNVLNKQVGDVSGYLARGAGITTIMKDEKIIKRVPSLVVEVGKKIIEVDVDDVGKVSKFISKGFSATADDVSKYVARREIFMPKEPFVQIKEIPLMIDDLPLAFARQEVYKIPQISVGKEISEQFITKPKGIIIEPFEEATKRVAKEVFEAGDGLFVKGLSFPKAKVAGEVAQEILTKSARIAVGEVLTAEAGKALMKGVATAPLQQLFPAKPVTRAGVKVKAPKILEKPIEDITKAVKVDVRVPELVKAPRKVGVKPKKRVAEPTDILRAVAEITKPKARVKPVVSPAVKVKELISDRVIPKVKTPTAIKELITPFPPVPTPTMPTIAPVPFPPVSIPLLFKEPRVAKPRKKGIVESFFRKGKYSPSLKAVLGNITGDIPKKVFGKYTGLEFRPIRKPKGKKKKGKKLNVMNILKGVF